MTNTRIKVSSIVENQLPQFVREEFPLVSEFLKQYYISLESQGNVSDLLQNIDQYIKVDNLANLIESTTLTSNVTLFDTTINVNSTAGFPDSYGLLLINDEIITYESKTSTTFDGCVRGFSGNTSYTSKIDELVFTDTEVQEHTAVVNGIPTNVTNLSVLFLKEFFNKIKKQFIPGFENRELYSELNQGLFIKQAIDFYSSKGTDNSFKILFSALYGLNVEVIKPRDYLIQPSDAQYRITSELVVEAIEGNPEELVNGTLYQDETDIKTGAQGTITKIEKIRRNDKDYYKVSLDYDYGKDIQVVAGTVLGDFLINPKTRVVSDISLGSNTLEVDSTVPFPNNNGNLSVDLENGTTLSISYTSKTLNQFLGCVGITQDIPANTEIKDDSFVYGYSQVDGEIVKVRILGVISELDLTDDTLLYTKGDRILIKTLGEDLKDYKSNNWFFNISPNYKVKSIDLLDSTDKIYRINLYDPHIFKVGDSVTLVSSIGEKEVSIVDSFDSERSFTITLGNERPLLNLSLEYNCKRNISKIRTDNYPLISQYTSNVQNVYYEDNGDFLYVTSPSIPTYKDVALDVNDRSVQFTGTFSGEVLQIGNHAFFTGDAIVYKPSQNNSLGISTGTYFVKRESSNSIRLAKSRSNIFSENFISVNGNVQNAKFEYADFVYADLNSKLLEPQKIIRKLSSPENDSQIHETQPGTTGIFINGVELLNYKSNDNVYYGPIEDIVITSEGSGYDVINPPTLTIVDNIGSGAKANCSVIGQLERVDIIDPGFDYLEEPIISISGGNGFGAEAKANLVSFDYNVSFNTQSYAGVVNLHPSNSITFPNEHRFRDVEEVVYITNGQTSVGGLSTNSSYYISVQNEYTIKLYKSSQDAVSGVNPIQLTSYGFGDHIFKSKNKKKKIGSIIVSNKGSNYQNKLVKTNSSGINTDFNVITIKNHGYNSGEIITYNATEISVGGLSSASSYYVTKIDSDRFKLSQVGVSSLGITTSFYYDTKQYVNLSSKGTGTHKFNYPEIKLSIKGKTGVSTYIGGQNFSAVLNPIFRGKINSVFVEDGGSNYGSEEIINYNRQPHFELNSGSGALLKTTILDGKIVNVNVVSSGANYNSPPNLEIVGVGTGALLCPVLSNGSLIEVKVIYGGSGYESKSTSVSVIPAGSGSKFSAIIKSWKINIVERLYQTLQISDDDGILISSPNNYGLEYTHAYAPRKLRQSVQGIRYVSGQKIYIPDLQISDNKEIESNTHSPIIGWAYDGNPIYGPYGYDSSTGGSIKLLKSGYEQDQTPKPNRPSNTLYPIGFFVEDYTYKNSGDLDEYNGRFTITPEYPNGIYAYFITLSENLDSFGNFTNYKKPIFPYAIGPYYKSTPIEFNFSKSSNQDDININDTNWRRNTTPYALKNKESGYDYLLNPNDIRQSNAAAQKISSGSISSIKINNAGKNYQVGDNLVFNKQSDFNSNVRAKVSQIKGKSVSSISVATSSFSDVEFLPYKASFIGFTSVPHNYLNNDLITIYSNYIDENNKSGQIKVSSNSLNLTVGFGTTGQTGIVTYFNVSGNLNYPNIAENDLYEIGNEIVKVLDVDPQSSRIKVIRNVNNIAVTSHFAGEVLKENTRKFELNFGISTSYSSVINREFYFNPRESIGLGTYSGVGIVSTLYFSNPGAGITQINIPTQTIYLKNHNLKTGDSLVYTSNGGTAISISTNGIYSAQLPENSVVYVAKINNDLIGISTLTIGIGSTGSYVSSGSTSGGLLYFTSVGDGNNHSFKTNYSNVLKGKISKNVVNVSTAETHGLSLLDEVEIEVKSGLSTEFIVKYDNYNDRIIINPRTFSSIDTEGSVISISKHGYQTGQKVIYTSNTPSANLTNNEVYYVVVVDNDKIRLSHTYYDATKKIPDIIGITSSTPGTISPINPPIKLTRNQNVVFNLSDSSLSYTSGSNVYSSFDFKLYLDPQLKEEFNSTQTSSTFEVLKSGKIGIDSTANLTLKLNDNVPDTLYYGLTSLISNTQVQNDDEIVNYNKIIIENSAYNGKYKLVSLTATEFKYNILKEPEIEIYTNNVNYSTNAKTAFGGIEKISVINGGRYYSSLPGITTVISSSGSEAILVPETNTIGKVLSTEIQDIGFDYSADYSIRPKAKLPTIISLNSYSTLDYVGITSSGRNYSSPPNLVLLDGLTNKVDEDVELKYSLNDSNVTIVKNTTKLNSVPPKIVPVNNSNGLPISSIVFNNTTKDVVVTIGASFSSILDFPFAIGDKILIEGINVLPDPDARGYNSSNYNYSLFVIKSTTPNIGGIGATISYNMSNYLIGSEVPGTFNDITSIGKIIPESYFPIFNPVLKKNNFYIGENIFSSTASGKVDSWDFANQYLKISTFEDFEVGDIVKGETSKAQGVIVEIFENNLYYKVDSYTPFRKGWNRETGFLNNDFQRIHDNDYYQYFSYVLRSQKDIGTWENAVNSLNHTAGFKKFSNLIVESNQSNLGITTDQNEGDVKVVADLMRIIDLECVYDYDLASENNIILNGSRNSNEIIFNSRLIQDYIESVNNRVLMIDDISEQFNSSKRSTQFVVVDSYLLNDFRSKKYIILIQDKKSSKNKEIALVSFIHNDQVGFINQYGSYTTNSLGFFDFSISDQTGNLLFYPKKTRRDNYHIQSFSFTLRDVASGIGTLSLGDSVKVDTDRVVIPQNTSTPVSVVSVSSTYRSGKVLVQIGSSESSYYEYDEVSFVNDGTNVHLLEYGQVTADTTSLVSSSGIGSYNSYITDSEVIIELVPYENINYETVVSTSQVLFSNSSSSGSTDEEIFGYTNVSSISTSITSSPTPVPNIISNYSNNARNFSYSILSIEDKTNSQYQLSELWVLSEGSNCYVFEYGVVETGSSLGIITASSINQQTTIYFTPIPDVDVDVKIFEVQVGLDLLPSTIDLENGTLQYNYAEYIGTELDLKTSFDLTHKNNPIFKRRFDGSNSDIVDVTRDTIKIPNHFFVTGEEIEYSHISIGYGSTSEAIGIATTTISGIGVTDKLPQNLYAVKVNDIGIKVAISATDALKPVPTTIDLTSVGIGTNHFFTAKNQNKKALISIDNVIQSPVALTPVTTESSNYMDFFDSEVYVSGIGSIYSGDIIKIDNEYMRVYTVGVGSTNAISVIRPYLGSGLSTHSPSSLVTKVTGNYNIIENTIHFSEAPYGKIPQATAQSRPDEIDYVGLVTHSTFSGRVFTRSGITGSGQETYSTNYIFDDISSEFDSTKKDFILKSEGINVAGISTTNTLLLINEVFQGHSSANSVGDYILTENVGVTTISFTGVGRSTDYDVNTSGIPKGGIIVSVASTKGFGYQPLISAGGTAIVSTSGTIQSISIGNSGSGYRAGIQTMVNVGVKTENLDGVDILYVGTASVSNGRVVGVSITNPGFGYTTSNPPIVIFDAPLSYSNIPLLYSSKIQQSGIGTGAKVDIVVGQGSSVISFELKNLGYSYKRNEVLTIPVGGATGIPTNTSLSFTEFQITIDDVKNDKFTSWAIGSLKRLDAIDRLFDGVRRKFPISIDSSQISLTPRPGSNIDIQATLLVFINDILQVPGQSYIFNGGSFIRFTEAPKPGDTSKLIFYGGTEDVDTVLVDVLETVEVGDNLTLNSDDFELQEEARLVVSINSPDIAETNLYSGPGITNNENLLRPVEWCRRRNDIFINGNPITKDRALYESIINPFAYIIKSISPDSTTFYVDNIRPFFNPQNENPFSLNFQKSVTLISQDSVVGASATAVVSAAGTISSIIISNGGSGYSVAPTISIQNSVGVGTTIPVNALAIANVNSGVVTSITITNPGVGYTISNPPVVLIESPNPTIETNKVNSYSGDSGIIVGFGTTSVSGDNAMIFDLYIPENSYLRKSTLTGTAVTLCSLSAGDYFIVNNSNVGYASTSIISLDNDGNIIGIGTQYIDNVYQVYDSKIIQKNIAGIGVTYVTRVFSGIYSYKIEDFSSTLITFDSTVYSFDSSGAGIVYNGDITSSNNFGNYSWGKIQLQFRTEQNSYNFYGNRGVGGISTSAIVKRTSPLKYKNYTTL